MEELRARTKALDWRRREMMDELEEARQAKEKAEEEQMEAERSWRSRVEKVEVEQTAKLEALSGEIQTLKKREEQYRSRLEENPLRVTVPMMEEQKGQIFSPADEEVRRLKEGRRSRGVSLNTSHLLLSRRSRAPLRR